MNPKNCDGCGLNGRKAKVRADVRVEGYKGRRVQGQRYMGKGNGEVKGGRVRVEG